MSQSYSPSMCTAVYQQPAASSIFNPHYNAICPPSPVTWTICSQTTIAPRPPPNCNPFYLKFITGNIRMCQGCRHTLRLVDGTVPPSPNDLTIARAEIHPYRDSSGNLICNATVSRIPLRLDNIVGQAFAKYGDVCIRS